MQTEVRISATAIDEFVWSVKKYLMEKYGCSTADREIYPLVYYISTGRAPTLFLKKLINRKPYTIGRILHKGGSDYEVIKKIKSYLKF